MNKNNSDQLKFSVIIPAFNAEKYIQQAVESVLNQSENSFEIIVCDDLSTDRTVEIIQEMSAKDSRIKLIRNEVNKGPSFSRNQAISIANGKWIALLDADDFYHSERLKHLVKLAEENNADFLADNLIYVDMYGENPTLAWPTISGNGKPYQIDSISFVKSDFPIKRGRKYGYTKPIMRRSFLLENQIKYDETTRIGEDFMFYLESLLKNARFFITREAYYYYRVVPTSISRVQDNTKLERLNNNNAKLQDMVKSLNKIEVLNILKKREKEYSYSLVFNKVITYIKNKKLSHAVLVLMQHPAAWGACAVLAVRHIKRSVSLMFSR